MPADAVDEPLPGHVVAVRFESDHWWHERLLVWPVTTSAWCVYTPDGDFYTEPTMVWEEVLFLERAGVRPAAMRGANVVEFDPAVSLAELSDLVRSGRNGAIQAVMRLGGLAAPVPTRMVGPDGTIQALPRPQRLRRGQLPVLGPPVTLARSHARRRGPLGDTRGDLIKNAFLAMIEAEDLGVDAPLVLPIGGSDDEWRVAEPGSAFGPVGTIVSLADMVWTGRLWGVAADAEGNEVPVQKVAVADKEGASGFLKARAATFLSLLPPPLPPPDEDPAVSTPRGARADAEAAEDLPKRPLTAIGQLRAQLGGRTGSNGLDEVLNDAGEGDPGGGGAAGNTEAEIDVRVLEVDYDAQGVRYKPWKAVVAECVIHYFRDWPLDGPMTALGVMKHMEKFGPMPTQWVEAFARRKHLATTDRAYHELMLLAEAFEAFGCYDQLNMPTSAGVEILMRRFQTILEAHAVPGAKPNYSMAASYSGVAMMEDGVSPELRTYGARRLKEKYLESQVQRIGRGGGAAPTDNHGAVDDPIADGYLAAAAAGTTGAAPEGSGAGQSARGGASKGRGRGRGRRGLAPPAAPQS